MEATFTESDVSWLREFHVVVPEGTTEVETLWASVHAKDEYSAYLERRIARLEQSIAILVGVLVVCIATSLLLLGAKPDMGAGLSSPAPAFSQHEERRPIWIGESVLTPEMVP